MSKSIHTTYKDLKGLSKSELEDMTNDSDSALNDLAEKRAIKKKVKQDRKLNKNK
nr:hypothetical protein [uncultured Carboxylicivirga sp.]